MEIIDSIYGKEKIDEPVLIELINSKSIQRLKGISQLGMPDEYYYKKGFSRFEHSLGVFLLLRKLGSDLDEQISGLLHDVSHTAFSHVIDWIFGDPIKEDYQDNNHLEVIKNSEIPEILNRYNFSFEYISKLENFLLLEKEAPSLCADRIDYSLRELFYNKGSKNPKLIFNNLFVKSNQIVFKNKNIAEIFFKEYSNLQENSLASDEARTRYYLLSELLKKGLEKKIISFEDFYKTDNYVLNILRNSNDKDILNQLKILKNGSDIYETENGIGLKKKFRYVDPEVSVNGSYERLSCLSDEYAEIIGKQEEKSKLVRKIKITPK
ncbi:MAG: HD domain-containing protein [Candidatus Pacearchaeota archaeon]|jgi:HD superfamily phosphohydrolase